jgi:hypothetical protein
MAKQSNSPHSDRSFPSKEPLFVWRAPGVSDELHEAFMRSVEDFENAPQTTLSRLLIADGIQLPPPDSFTEETVHDKLWEVINAMARHRNYMSSTNHLSDLEFYRYLWEETLNSPFKTSSPGMSNPSWHIDIAGDGSEESDEIWLRYYADEYDRREWLEHYPETPLPDRAEFPKDRDRLLPKH